MGVFTHSCSLQWAINISRKHDGICQYSNQVMILFFLLDRSTCFRSQHLNPPKAMIFCCPIMPGLIWNSTKLPPKRKYFIINTSATKNCVKYFIFCFVNICICSRHFRFFHHSPTIPYKLQQQIQQSQGSSPLFNNYTPWTIVTTLLSIDRHKNRK